MSQAVAVEDPTALYHQLDTYDWENDVEFQAGLRSLLASAPADQISRLILRVRCYYFAKKFDKKPDFNGYLAWTEARAQGSNQPISRPVVNEISQPQPPQDAPNHTQASDPAGSAPHPASFAEICQLIAEGKPIPGIKDIPDIVLEGQSTPSHAPKRKKPWEKDVATTPTSSQSTLLNAEPQV
ncbi:hypothetical protein AAFC00_007145 [Neodothiora populina]|uniref:Uncharacterized protein n=1 Tax=Neodothiora populina TaxID=2781224 RepID=A0ABR3PHB6_9PEZI